MDVTMITSLPNGKVRIADRRGRIFDIDSSSVKSATKVQLQTDNYSKLLFGEGSDDDKNWGRFLSNTLLVTSSSIAGQVLTCSVVGWGFARLKFKGRKLLFLIMLGTMMVPNQVTMVPTFALYRWLGLVDTFVPIIVPSWLGGAFFSFLYRQYYLSIPVEMDEAAKLDGCSSFQTYWNILLPMAKPVTITVATYTFINTWNEFLSPLIYINSDYKRTLSLALAKFQGAYSTDIPMLMAASTLMLIPIVIVYCLAQRQLVEGMSVSGVKG